MPQILWRSRSGGSSLPPSLEGADVLSERKADPVVAGRPEIVRHATAPTGGLIKKYRQANPVIHSWAKSLAVVASMTDHSYLTPCSDNRRRKRATAAAEPGRRDGSDCSRLSFPGPVAAT